MRIARWLLPLLLLSSPAIAQWQVPLNTIPIGRGAGVTGFSSAANTGTGTLCFLNTTVPSFGACPLAAGAALTKTDDTNVTLTLGGTPTTALLRAASLTLGWTGTLAVARGGTGISSLGTGVATALGVNIGSAGAFVTFNGALGTPSSGTLTNATGLPIGSGVSGLGTGVATAAGTNLSAAGGLTTTIASGTANIPNSAISSGTCGTAITVAATNVATTDVVAAGFNADPTAVTGFLPTAMLTIVPYPTAGNVNFKVCNLTGSSITPTATTFNWRVTR